MKNVLWVIVACAAIVGIVAAIYWPRNDTPAAAPGKPEAQPPAPQAKAEKAPPATSPAEKSAPPSKTDEEPLLLLDSGPAKSLPPAKGPMADNNRCHVCHGNFSDEDLAFSHARNNVGCERCHGASDTHCEDEGNVTAPTILIGRERIDKSCKECHPPPDEKIVQDARYCLFIPDEKDSRKVCTECHGKHRMNQRTVHWDKTTGKLLPKGARAG
jgi:hypothetical protein